MSAPAFGYSAGDFIAAVTLIAKVTKALKDAGGAREEYQALVSELGLLNQMLEKLQPNAEPTKADDHASSDAFANFARQQAKVTISELTQFLERISKFGSSMGEASKSGWHRSIPRKAQWAVHYADEVEKMRAKLGTQLQIILVASSIDGEQLARKPHKQLMSTERTTYATKDEIQTLVRYEFTLKIDQVLSKLKTLEAYSVASAIQCPEITSDLANISADKPAMFINADNRVEDMVLPLGQNTLPQGAQSSKSELVDGDARGLVHKTPLSEEDDVKRLLLALLRAMTKSAQKLLLSLWKVIPQYVAFFQLLSLTIRREPMLAAADCINFEDMLGRKFYLNYQYYKHWPTFEAFLSQQFRNVPGQRHVSERQYRITRDDTLIPDMEWAQTMKPESDVEMSGLLLSWKTAGEECPKPGCSGKGSRPGQTSFLKCSACELIYSCDESLQQPSELPFDLGFVEILDPEPNDDAKHFRRIHVSLEVWEPLMPPKPILKPTVHRVARKENGKKGKPKKQRSETDSEYTSSEASGRSKPLSSTEGFAEIAGRSRHRVLYRVSEETPQMLEPNQRLADRFQLTAPSPKLRRRSSILDYQEPYRSGPRRYETHAVEVEPAQSRRIDTDSFGRTTYRGRSHDRGFGPVYDTRGYGGRARPLYHHVGPSPVSPPFSPIAPGPSFLPYQHVGPSPATPPHHAVGPGQATPPPPHVGPTFPPFPSHMHRTTGWVIVKGGISTRRPFLRG